MSAVIPPELLNSANSSLQSGNLAQCVEQVERILAIKPNHVPTLILGGIATLRLNQPETAQSYFDRAKAADPKCAPAFLWSSMTLRRLGHIQPALEDAKRSFNLGQQDPLALHHLAQCLIDGEQFSKALPLLNRAYAAAPKVAAIHLALGTAYQGLANASEAIASYRRAIQLEPANIEALSRLRQILLEEGDTHAAVGIAQTVVTLRPDSAEDLLWLARAHIEESRSALADPLIQQALKLQPDSSLAHSLLGSVLQMSGQILEAGPEFRRSIELDPSQGSAYLALATNQKLTEADRPFVDQMVNIATRDDLPKSQLSLLLYAIGKACEDLGEYEGAMGYLDSANRLAYELKFGQQKFDPKALGPYEVLPNLLKHASPSQVSNGEESDLEPIFVVGMIRSGTTLVEQILSAHPQVGAAGEQKFWLENGAAAITGNGTRIDREHLARLAARYRRHLREISPFTYRVVDKMPQNYQALGLIRLAFPNAKIVHIRRHPIDTCLSIYATPNRNRLRWAHNKANIVSAYERYLQTMDAYRSILPSSHFLEVDYEELTRDPDTSIRRLVEFCELDGWDDACLHPENNVRTVVTPSVWQVRQPIYRTSVARWKKFEPWLGEFARLNP